MVFCFFVFIVGVILKWEDIFRNIFLVLNYE